MTVGDERREPMLDVAGQYAMSRVSLGAAVRDILLVAAGTALLYAAAQSEWVARLAPAANLAVLLAVVAVAGALGAAVLWGMVYRVSADHRAAAMASALLMHGLVAAPLTLAATAVDWAQALLLSARMSANLATAVLFIIAGGPKRLRPGSGFRAMTGWSLLAVGTVAVAAVLAPAHTSALASSSPARSTLAILLMVGGVRIYLRGSLLGIAASVRAGLGVFVLAAAFAEMFYRKPVVESAQPDLTLVTLRLFAVGILLVSGMQLTRHAVDALNAAHQEQLDHLLAVSHRLARLAENDHELRTGLAGVAGATRLIGGGVDEDIEQGLETAVAAELRRLARLLAPGDANQAATADIRAVLDGLLRVHQPSGPGVRLDVPPDVTVGMDPAALTQVFVNLFTNCARHAPGSHVDVRARHDTHGENQVVIDVADQGPGVPAGREELVFDRGVRAMTSPGDGLGLHICRTLVTYHGGDIQIVPGSPGCTVRLRLPACASSDHLSASKG